MTTESNTFAALKYGIFTAEDIKQRWVTDDASRFTSLPLDVIVRWLELLRNRYVTIFHTADRSSFIEETDLHIEEAKEGNFLNMTVLSVYPSTYVDFFSFLLSYFIFTSSSITYSFSSYDFTEEVISETEINVGLLNKIIKEYVYHGN